jgi:hypothetical protein
MLVFKNNFTRNRADNKLPSPKDRAAAYFPSINSENLLIDRESLLLGPRH